MLKYSRASEAVLCLRMSWTNCAESWYMKKEIRGGACPCEAYNKQSKYVQRRKRGIKIGSRVTLFADTRHLARTDPSMHRTVRILDRIVLMDGCSNHHHCHHYNHYQ
jgi:hypothetical protein